MDAEQLAHDLSLAEENITLLEQQLEAAKQENLELLAVIEQAKQLFAEINHTIFTMPPIRIGDSTIVDEVDVFLIDNSGPAQVLREHEAKLLEEAADVAKDLSERTEVFECAEIERRLRRMAEERRKK